MADADRRGIGSVWGNVRAVWRVLEPAERRNWLVLVPLGALAAAVEVACAGAVFGLVAALTDPAAAPAWAASLGISSVLSLAVVTGGMFVLKAGVILALLHANHRAVERGRAGVAGRLYAAALDAPWTQHLERGLVQAAHDLLARAAVVFDAVVGPAAQIAVNTAVALGLLAVMFAVAPGVTGVVALALGAWLVVLHGLSRRLADRAGAAEDQAGRAVLSDVWQGLGALREIRAAGGEAFFHARFVADQARLVRARYQRATLAALPRVWTETLFVFVMLGVVLALHGDRAPAETFGLLGLCAYAALRLLPIANAAAWQLGQIRWATPAVARLVEASAELAAGPRWRGSTQAPPAEQGAEVVVRDARFEWPDAEGLLAGANLRVEPGASVAIEGETGAGKSTLLALLAGLVEVESGDVRIAGEAPRAARVRVGYVPQEVVLLDASVRANVALGVPPDDVDEARINAALRTACVAERVAELPGGLDAAVGEGGARLSGGERQRIAIARALYHQPAVLLLDEATAALDAATEARLIERLIEATRGRCTLVVVTHRPGAAAGCEARWRLVDGQLIPA